MHSLILACSLAVLTFLHAQPHPAGGSAYASFHSRLYVQGGDLGGGNLVSQFYAMDLSRSWRTNSPTWNTLPAGPINAYHSGGFSSDSNSFVTFGREAGSPYTTANFINVFSTSTGSWIGTGSTIITDPTRRDMTIASDPSPGGQIYFMGGDAGQAGTGRSNAIDIYNTQSSVVSETTVPFPGPQNLQGGAATWLANRKSMLVIGGLSDNTETNVVYLFTPGSASSQFSGSSSTYSPPSSGSSYGSSSGSSSDSSSGSTSSSSFNSNVNNNNNINNNNSNNLGNSNGSNGFNKRATTYGSTPGSSSGGTSNSGSTSSTGSTGSNGWSAQPTTGFFPSSRTAHCVASNEDGSIVAVFGGFVNRSSASDHIVYLLDTRTWTWTASTTNTVRGRSYSACALNSGQLIVWGGFYANPTSSPNNLPSVEESTMVYSLTERNWVNTFTPSDSSNSGGSYGQNSGSGGNGNGGDLSHPNGTKSFGLVLAIAAVGAILALLITVAVVMVIRKRNQRRLINQGRRPSFNQANENHGQSSKGSSNSTLGGAPRSKKKSLIGTWDKKTLSNLENGLLHDGQGAKPIQPAKGGESSSSSKDDYGGSSSGSVESIPPVSSYNTWEQHQGSAQRKQEVTSKVTTSNMMMGITQTTITTTPSTSNKGISAPPSQRSQGSNKDLEKQSGVRAVTGYSRAEAQNLEQAFEEKSHGPYYPISVERRYE